jgi:hypothetical protein
MELRRREWGEGYIPPLVIAKYSPSRTCFGKAIPYLQSADLNTAQALIQ